MILWIQKIRHFTLQIDEKIDRDILHKPKYDNLGIHHGEMIQW